MNGVRLVWALLLCALAWPAQAATVRYVHTDALGSVVAVTDANRNVVERREYEPYGAQLTPGVADGPGYTGHVQDAATGLVYAQQRYYDPGIGRFLSVDPVTADANTGADFNRYQYAANNPYRFVDPDGRKEDEPKKPACQSGSLCNTSPGFRNSAVSGMVNRTPASARQNEADANSPSGHTISVRVNVSSKAEITDGHAWVNDSDSDGTNTSYGLWPDSHPSVKDNGSGTDVRKNLEIKFGYNDKFIAQKSANLTKAQYRDFLKFIGTSDSWGYTHTCADWARDAFRAATGDRLDADDYFGIETPRELSQSMGH